MIVVVLIFFSSTVGKDCSNPTGCARFFSRIRFLSPSVLAAAGPGLAPSPRRRSLLLLSLFLALACFSGAQSFSPPQPAPGELPGDDVEHAADAAKPRVVAAEDDPRRPKDREGRGAHHAGLAGDVEGEAFQGGARRGSLGGSSRAVAVSFSFSSCVSASVPDDDGRVPVFPPGVLGPQSVEGLELGVAGRLFRF